MSLWNAVKKAVKKVTTKKKSTYNPTPQSVKDKARQSLGVDKYIKPTEPKKVNSTLAKSMPYVSLPKTSKSVSTQSSGDKKKSNNSSNSKKSSVGSKSSNTIYSLTNPFAPQKAYASTGALASSNTPSSNVLNPNASYGLTTPMTSSASTTTNPGLSYQSSQNPDWNVVRTQGLGEGAWRNNALVTALRNSPIGIFNKWGNILSTERGITENALDFLNKVPLVSAIAPEANYTSVQQATNTMPVETTPEYKQAIDEATIAASEQGVDVNKYLEDQWRAMTASLPYAGGTGTEGTGTLAGIDTSAGTAWDPSNMPTGEEVFGALKKGMTAEQAAAMDAAIAEYDKQRALLQNQLGFAQQQRQNALDTYGNQYNDVVSQIANARTNAERDTEVGRQNVFDIAQNTQRSNRNVLRSLGILSSSAAGEMLNKPYTEASKQVGSMENQLIQRKKELDDLKIQKDEEFATNVKDLETNYSKMIADIQADIRYTEADKIAAVNQLTAAAQTRYAELQQAQLNWNNQLAAQQQQFALDIARMNAYSGNSITPEMSGILQSSMAVKV